MRSFTKPVILIIALLLFSCYCFSQAVGIGTATPNASAAVDITHASKGLLIPRMSTTAINNIVNPARGLMVYDSVTNQLMVNMGSSSSVNWQSITSKSAWNLGGNSGVNVVTQFVGTTDNRPLRIRVNGILAGEISPGTGNVSWGLRTNTLGYSNVAIGTDALKSNTGKANMVAIGDSALFNSGLGSTQPFHGAINTAIGSKSLFANTTGHSNTANGYQSLYSNTIGFRNTASGVQSLYSNSTGSDNTAHGCQALFSNTTGMNNTALGYLSLLANTTGNNNTATGYYSLFSNTTGINNSAYGYQSLSSNTTGDFNTGVGWQAMAQNISGTSNTAIGYEALDGNISGQHNTAVGAATLSFTTASNNNTALGETAGRLYNMGWNNTLIGADSRVSADGAFNNTALGHQSICTGNNQVMLGNTATNFIGGYAGFSNLSDGRFKRNIQESVKGLDFIMKLRPVTYQMDITGLNAKLEISNAIDELSKKSIAEKEKKIFTGFIAQEVEQAAREVGYDFSGVGKPQNEKDFYSLRYAEFVVPLVKALQEQQVMIEELKKRIVELEKK